MGQGWYTKFSLREMKRVYPKLMRVVRYIAEDNGGKLNGYFIREKYLHSSRFSLRLGDYEYSLGRLKDFDLQTLASGEHDDQMQLVSKYKLGRVNTFLSEVFDGKFSDTFYAGRSKEASGVGRKKL